jgi:hypothetical protein
LRYGIGVGREGFTWSGTERISRLAKWPDWNPPAEMIQRQPYLPRFMAGGEGNPLGARALYLGNTIYRIHGTNQPSTIGTFVSSGCIRLTNDDIVDHRLEPNPVPDHEPLATAIRVGAEKTKRAVMIAAEVAHGPTPLPSAADKCHSSAGAPRLLCAILPPPARPGRRACRPQQE